MQIIEQFTDLTPVNIAINVIDVLLVWYVVYKILTLIKGTKAVQLLKGIFRHYYCAKLLTESVRVRYTRLDARASN